MEPSATSHPRLDLLNSLSLGRPWKSPREKRRCIVCQRAFSAADVRVVKRGRIRTLACPTPTCDSDPDLWVNATNPLTSEEAWEDWERAIDLWQKRLEKERPQTKPARKRTTRGNRLRI
jgi:hypothetical protein